MRRRSDGLRRLPERALISSSESLAHTARAPDDTPAPSCHDIDSMRTTRERSSARSWGLALLTLCLAGCVSGCGACHEHTQTYTLSPSQIARVTEGTGSPTAAGCAVVCQEREYQHDTGTVDGGLPRPVPAPSVVGCSLTDQVLTCDFGRVCAV